MDKEIKSDGCLFCMRISLGDIMIETFDLFENEFVARKIARDVARLLQKVWEVDRISLCGRSPTGILGGALYICSLFNGQWIRQKQIAEQLGLSEVTIRFAYKRLLKSLNIDSESWHELYYHGGVMAKW